MRRVVSTELRCSYIEVSKEQSRLKGNPPPFPTRLTIKIHPENRSSIFKLLSLKPSKCQAHHQMTDGGYSYLPSQWQWQRALSIHTMVACELWPQQNGCLGRGWGRSYSLPRTGPNQEPLTNCTIKQIQRWLRLDVYEKEIQCSSSWHAGGAPRSWTQWSLTWTQMLLCALSKRTFEFILHSCEPKSICTRLIIWRDNLP